MPTPSATERGGLGPTAKGPRGPRPTDYKMPPTPAEQNMLQQFLQAAQGTLNLAPPLGFANKTYDTMAGVKRYQTERAAKGLTMQQRINGLIQSGVKDRQGMTEVARRMYASPQAAFMLSRR